MITKKMEELVEHKLQESLKNLPFTKNANKYQTESPLVKETQSKGKVLTDYYSDLVPSPTK